MIEMTKENKKVIKSVLDIIKKETRYDIEWEWIAEDKNGTYINRYSIINKLIELLNN